MTNREKLWQLFVAYQDAVMDEVAETLALIARGHPSNPHRRA